MFKRIMLIMCIGMFIFGISKISYAMSCHEDAGHGANMQTAQVVSSPHSAMVYSESALPEAVNVGNKICPVTGEKVDEKTKATFEYKGKIYNFCCSACIDDFKKDPDKYIKKVEEELNGAPEEKSKEHMTMSESGMMNIQDNDSQHHGN